MKKRALAILLAILLAAMLLPACANDTPDTPPVAGDEAAETQEETQEEAAPPTDIIEIGYASWNGGEIQRDEEAWFEQYMIDNPHIRIVPQFITGGDYWTVINTLFAAGEGPCVFFGAPPISFTFDDRGLVHDLYPKFLEAGIDMFEVYLESTLGVTADGRVISLAHGLTTVLLYFNKDLFDELGVPYPSQDYRNPMTWDEFRETARLLTRDSEGRTPDDPSFDSHNFSSFGVLAPVGMLWLEALLPSNNAGFLNVDAEHNATSLALIEPEAREVLQAIADLIFVDRVAPSAAIADALPGTVAMFQDNQLGMVISGGWLYSQYHAEGIDVGIAPLPMFREPVSLAWGASYMLSTQSPHPEEAFSFLKDFLNPELNPCLNKNMAPNMRSMYVGDALESWMDGLGDFFNDDYRKVIPNLIVNGINLEHLMYRDFEPIISNTALPILDRLWLGEADIDEVIAEIEAATVDFFR